MHFVLAALFFLSSERPLLQERADEMPREELVLDNYQKLIDEAAPI